MIDKVVITKSKLDNLARAVSNKSGAALNLTIDQMVTAVNSITTGGGITPTGTIQITSNGTVNVTNYASAEVNVPTGSTINNQDKTVTPSISQQTITADSGYTGLGTVTVNAMPSLTLPTSTAANATFGYTKKATVSRSTSTQYINIDTGYNAVGGYYEISAVANGTAGTPTATKGTVSNNSISITPSVTNTTGYITGGTKNGTAVTVSASELVSGTLSVTSNGTKDVTNYASVDVNISSEAPSIESLSITPSESEQTFNASTVDGYKPVTVSAISSTYVGSGVTQRSSTDLTVSGATVTALAGYYSAAASKSVASGSASAPSSISGTSASVTTGTNTLTLTKTVSVTPAVSAGYVSSGTATNSSVSLTASVTTKSAATITPTTTNQTIAAGTYLTGAQTIVGDADLIGSNILSTANIFGVQGTVDFIDVYVRSTAPTSSVGNDGDIYIQE